MLDMNTYYGGPFKVHARSDLAIIGRDAEYADMDNPNGNIYGEVWYIIVENGFGRRWRSYRQFESQIQADHDASVAADFLANEKRLNPDNWFEIDPCYGSRAYEAMGIETQRAEEERREVR